MESMKATTHVQEWLMSRLVRSASSKRRLTAVNAPDAALLRRVHDIFVVCEQFSLDMARRRDDNERTQPEEVRRAHALTLVHPLSLVGDLLPDQLALSA